MGSSTHRSTVKKWRLLAGPVNDSPYIKAELSNGDTDSGRRGGEKADEAKKKSRRDKGDGREREEKERSECQ